MPAHKKRWMASLVFVLLYSFLSIAYFNTLDCKFYLKNILNCNIIFAVPIPYIILMALFIFIYPLITGEKRKRLVWPIIVMSLALTLIYLLAVLKVGFLTVNPLSGRRNVYGIYAAIYIMTAMSLFSAFAGFIFRKFAKGDIQNLIFHFPILVYFTYIIGMLSANGFVLYAAVLTVIFLLALFSQKTSDAARYAVGALSRLIKNEKTFLILIFVISFLVRYFWGDRLLALTGAKFPTASDDGPCYDSFAQILSQGKLLGGDKILVMTGYGYWYFLAAIYKIFGVHNFRAAFIIQSFIGSFVPVIVYFIAKFISSSRIVPVLAGIVASLDLTLVFLSVIIGMESLYIPLVCLALALAIYFIQPGRLNYKNAFVVGCAFGLAYNTRPPELLPYMFILAVIIWISLRRSRRSVKSTPVIAALLVGFILLISFQYVRNYIVYGEKRIVPGAATASFHNGIAEGALVDENKQLWKMGFSPFEDFKGSLNTLVHKPVPVVKLIAAGFVKRLTIFLFVPDFGVFDSFYLINPGTGYFVGFPVYLQTLGYIVAAMGAVAMLRRRENPIGLAILFTFVIYMSSRVAFFYAFNSRYRGVLMPVFILFFAYGAALFYKKIKDAYKS